MANNKSAEKRIKTNERNRLTNRFIKLQFEL
jgi:ribosomal protein S20